MKLLANALKWLGYIYLTLALIIIAASYVIIAINHGFGKVVEILSPFNMINFAVTVLTLAPGIGLIWLSNKLADRQARAVRPSGGSAPL